MSISSLADSRVDGRRVIVLLGELYIAYAAGRVLINVATGQPLVAALIDFVLVGGPGLAILYGGYRLPRTDLHPETYWRIAGWCIGGLVVMSAVFGLVVANPAVTNENPLWTAALVTAVGGVAGLAIGLNEARAVTRAREAEAHKRQLGRQNDRLESLSRMLAHELRNPLSIAQVYLASAVDGDDRAAGEVETALERIEEMIDILLITARSGDVAIDGETVDLADAAADAWAEVTAEGATLTVDDDRTIRADPVHVHYLLENLFRNAVQHGGDAVSVRLGGLEDGFYVADDGRGIPEADRSDVFEAGYTTDSNGIGLGLTFVAHLAAAYDWDCSVTTSEAGGTRIECRGVETVPIPSAR
ncbi:sensor histidine kinase [Natrononativus amylolyticus]|uniref:sensor histidine kinase n=1 Tax=Natrononativus amylolyticus TaxID=2963434 RepID=UPI0020CC1CEB|nr:ATP-binding protein [Natrononativus amylolyticus]